jgi:purine-nucleoside phosphorylase
MALSNSLAQAYSAPEYRGRVMSIYMLNWGMTSIGIFIVALIADVIGVQIAVGTTAALLVLVTGYYMFVSKRIYNLD